MRVTPAPHPSQGYSDREANRTPAAPSIGAVCPDVAAVLHDLKLAGITYKPSKLQRLYDSMTANADADFDFGSAVLTYLTRSGSVAVDRRVGDRVAKDLT